jgi:hypothetical protein
MLWRHNPNSSTGRTRAKSMRSPFTSRRIPARRAFFRNRSPASGSPVRRAGAVGTARPADRWPPPTSGLAHSSVSPSPWTAVYGPTERSSDEFLGDFHHGLLAHRHRLTTPSPQPEAAFHPEGRTAVGPSCRSGAIFSVRPSPLRADVYRLARMATPPLFDEHGHAIRVRGCCRRSRGRSRDSLVARLTDVMRTATRRW